MVLHPHDLSEPTDPAKVSPPNSRSLWNRVGQTASSSQEHLIFELACDMVSIFHISSMSSVTFPPHPPDKVQLEIISYPRLANITYSDVKSMFVFLSFW